MIGKLIIYAYAQGYELTFGEGYDDDNTGHMKGSVHYSRLGQDLNTFKDGVWIKDGSIHTILHNYWDTLGGAKRIDNDLNHYSLEWEGIR